MRIAIIGSGYVGLVSGACLADFGHVVTCIDQDHDMIEKLRHGEIPIYEPGLSELVANNVRSGRLSFTTEMAAAVSEAGVVFLAVGTPSRRGDGHADLSHVYAAARELAPHLSGTTVVTVKSTVPVGTGDEVDRILREANPDASFSVASNPEFLREGAAIGDFKRPDRIIVGIEDDAARQAMREVYGPLSLNEPPLVFVSRRTAELTKYAANAYLAMKVTFINEIADLCESVDANVQDVARGIGLDRRIGPKFLNAGPGYGGSCFPKDTLALSRTARDHGRPLRLVETTIDINEKRKIAMADRVIEACGGTVEGKTIALLGVTFKPETDDIRDAPALDIARRLLDAGARLRIYDPQGMSSAFAALPEAHFAEDAYAAVEDAHAVAIITEWDEFRALDLSRMARLMQERVIVDMRNIYRASQVQPLGFRYVSIGRPVSERQ